MQAKTILWNPRSKLFSPQIFRNSEPPTMNQYYTTIKLSSLASIIGVFEIVNTSSAFGELTTTDQLIELLS